MVIIEGATGVKSLTHAELAQRLLDAEAEINRALDSRPDSEAERIARDDFLRDKWAVVEGLRRTLRGDIHAVNEHYDRWPA